MSDVISNEDENAPAVRQGFPGVDGSTRATRLSRRAALKVEDAERAVMLICAELTALRPERELFSPVWPLRQENAYRFRLKYEEVEASPEFRTFFGTFAGRSRDRDAVLNKLSALRSALPLCWTTVSGGGVSAPVTLATLAADGEVEYDESPADGNAIFTAALTLKVRVCTTCPRGY